MKKYNNPMLQVFCINDIIATSEIVQFGDGKKAGNAACVPGRRDIFDRDAGY